MHGVEAAQDLAYEVDDEIVLELPAVQSEAAIEMPEIASRNILERQIGLTIDLTVTEHVNYVRMRHATRESRFLREHLLCVGFVCEVWEHSL